MSSQGLLVTHIDKDSTLGRWSLSEIMAQSFRPPPADPVEAKFQQRLFEKLKYCREVLVSIRNASTNVVNGATTEVPDVPFAGAPPAVSARSSKTSLR